MHCAAIKYSTRITFKVKQLLIALTCQFASNQEANEGRGLQDLKKSKTLEPGLNQVA